MYEDEVPLFVESRDHDTAKLSPAVMEQFELRHRLLLDVLTEKGIDPASLHACVGRGGLLPPVRSGAYRVNDAMLDVLRHRPVMQHASNLGAVLADAVARPLGIPAFIYDPVTVDEMDPIARITGFSSIERKSVGHMLNMRACALRYATQNNAKYPERSSISSRTWAGGSPCPCTRAGVSWIRFPTMKGQFAPERSGGLPCFQLAEVADGGWRHLPRDDAPDAAEGGADGLVRGDVLTRGEIERWRIPRGWHGKAALVYEAMAHNLAKNIGKLAVVTRGRLDAILLTGGVARSRMLTDWVAERASFLAPVHVLPGENEMESLALGVLRVLRGEEEAHTFAERTEDHNENAEPSDHPVGGACAVHGLRRSVCVVDFRGPVEQAFCWQRPETSLTFTFIITFFSLGMFAGGKLLRFGPARAVQIGGALLCVGLLWASRIDSVIGLYLSYGVVSGFGIGIVNLVPAAVCLRWYPERKGLAKPAC